MRARTGTPIEQHRALIAANLWLRYACIWAEQPERRAYAVARMRHYERQARILARTAAH